MQWQETRSEKHSDLQKILAFSLVLSGFCPYLAFEVGANSHIPFTVMLSVVWLLISARKSPPFGMVVLWLAPVVSVFCGVIFGVEQAPSALPGCILFVMWSLPMLATYNMVKTGYVASLRKGLKVGLVLSSVYALWQAYEISNDNLPFKDFYELNGYPSAQGTGPEGVFSTQRPYGWFPEPSFLAGSICLGVLALVICEKCVHGRLTKSGWLIVLLSTSVGLLTRSGVVIACVLPIVILILVGRTEKKRALSLIFMLLAGSYFALWIYQSRTGESGWSWGDRYASTYGVLRFALQSWNTTLFGIGRDSGAFLFGRGSIQVLDLSPQFLPRGVYSTIVRYIAEGGILFGLVPLLIVSIGLFSRLRAVFGGPAGLCAVLVWLLVPLLGISYDTAALIWMVGGVLYGINAVAMRSEVPELRAMPITGTNLDARRRSYEDFACN
jgi:hypothetical protein